MKKLSAFIIAVVTLVAIFNGCKKDEPAKPAEVKVTANTTIADLKAKLTSDMMEITDSLIIEGTVISSDESGNIYKSLFIQDATGGIELKLDKTSLFTEYPLGQKIFVSCKRLFLGKYGGVTQLGSTFIENNVTKFGRIQGAAIGLHIIKSKDAPVLIAAKDVTLAQITDNMIGTLVKISDVQFVAADTALTFANASGTSATNRNIETCAGGKIILRNSDFAAFKATRLPDGKGTITAILSKYNADYQLYINKTEDVAMTGARCVVVNPNGTELLTNDFATSLGTNWIAKSVLGDQTWVYEAAFGKLAKGCAKMTGYVSSTSTVANEDWLITPAINCASFTTVTLNFQSAQKYDGDATPDLEVYVSTNYDGTSAPSAATWTKINPTLSTGNFTWTLGTADISAYKSANTRIAFKYVCGTSGASTWEIDDFVVLGKN